MITALRWLGCWAFVTFIFAAGAAFGAAIVSIGSRTPEWQPFGAYGGPQRPMPGSQSHLTAYLTRHRDL